MVVPKKVGFFREMRHGDPAGPSLREYLGQVDGEDRQQVVHYLRHASTLAATPGYAVDALDPSAATVGAPDLMTDGDWMWPPDAAYYVERYGVGLPVEFLDHMRSRKWEPGQLDETELVRIADEMVGSP